MAMKRVGNLSYDMKTVHGRGRFSTVFHGSLEINNGTSKAVAVKRIQNSEPEAPFIQREVELMQKVSDHPNILLYICTEIDDYFVFIATELCRGTLEEYVSGKYQGPRFKNGKEILRQVTQGLAHLHLKGIVHRDVKPTNILIFVPDEGLEEEPQIKLADFGLSKALEIDRDDYTNTNVTNPNGTRGWMAPEMYQLNRIDSKVDIFPLGCIFAYTLTEGKHPFGDDPDLRIGRIKQKGAMTLIQTDLKNNDSYSAEEAFEIIKTMLDMDPANRPTADEVLNGPFFLVVHTPTIEIHQPIVFSMDRTKQLMKLCFSFEASITDDKIAQFKELVNDERVDVKAINFIYFLCCCKHEQQNLLMELVLLMIMKGTNVNAKTLTAYYGHWTPLHVLSENEELNDQLKIDLVQLLLQSGADVNIKDGNGRSPLYNFCRHCRNDNLVSILQLLIENGAKVNDRDDKGNTPLHELCQNYTKDHNNLTELVRLFVKYGAEVNAKRSSDAGTPILLLCLYQRENEKLMDVIRLLIEAGADVKAGWTGYTPLHALCEFYGREEVLMDIVKLMIGNGADINSVDSNSRSGKSSLNILRKRGFHV